MACPTISIRKSNQEYCVSVVADKSKESFDDNRVSQVKTHNKARILHDILPSLYVLKASKLSGFSKSVP